YPLPERKCLRMRVIDAKNADALIDPELQDTLEFVPKSWRCRRLEIERIDVLIFFRRILGVLNRSVRPLAEPFRMLMCIRMVGRTLERDVQRDFQAVFRRGGEKVPEVL